MKNRRILLPLGIVLSSLLAPAISLAGADASVPETGGQELIPLTLTNYSSSEAAAALLLESNEPEVLRKPGAFLSDDFTGGSSIGKQSWWPLLYSALVPGTGELAMGYEKRGIALMAAETIAWAGYFSNRSQGLDSRDEYEAFADENWSEQKFLTDHPLFPGQPTVEDLDREGAATSGSGTWPGYNPWIPKSEDKQHYYENIGKYDWYLSGWTDWDAIASPLEEQTDLRDEYRSLRKKSNDELDTANQFLYISLATRVFSLVETSLLIHRARTGYGDETSMASNHWTFHASPRGFDGGEVFMEYNFK